MPHHLTPFLFSSEDKRLFEDFQIRWYVFCYHYLLDNGIYQGVLR